MDRRHCVAALVVAALGAGAACAKDQATPPPPAQSAGERTAIAAAAKALIGNVPFATLTTVGDDGSPQARIVDPFPVEDDFTVWIATTGASRKVSQIERDARVTLLYFDQADPGYVSLLGTAAIVRDPAEKAKRWKESWVAFFKDKNRGDDYTLIRVTPSRLEISSQRRGMNNDPVTWTPVTLVLR